MKVYYKIARRRKKKLTDPRVYRLIHFYVRLNGPHEVWDFISLDFRVYGRKRLNPKSLFHSPRKEVELNKYNYLIDLEDYIELPLDLFIRTIERCARGSILKTRILKHLEKKKEEDRI